MKTTDIIRAVLDLLDKAEKPAELNVDYQDDESGEQTSRFKQILSMIQNKHTPQYSNSPNEVVAPIDAVTTDAGGGVNGPKHPEDIRVKDPRGY
jgi:hypothetical protein